MKITWILIIVSFIFVVLGFFLVVKNAILLDEMHKFNVELEIKTQQMLENESQRQDAYRLVQLDQELQSIKWELQK
jgi:cell division protein FtsX